ncbi:thioredoxin family protein [Algoriphagus limi]|uniref:Thioredoxin family protein n=1 Tax=Algoriphagus limi TaxID=2975273 RepID=A0ABT2G495_9BACT|nr:thioredoxin family protein [Algoriphagus limi]MCS5489912.1 thioredoxin family protein [Algoriphagus limi]
MLDQITKPKTITSDTIANAMTYSQYRELVDALFSEGKTTGENQSEAYLEYTRMAIQRMNRWDKVAKVSPEMEERVKKLPPQIWLVITEAWCGDAGQTIPYMNKLADLNPGIQLRLILRDENPDIIDAHLTNGARSIPKLIALSPGLNKEYFSWGPKPKYLIEKQRAFREDPKGKTSKEFTQEVHLWYARDKNQSLEQELGDCFSQAFDI